MAFLAVAEAGAGRAAAGRAAGSATRGGAGRAAGRKSYIRGQVDKASTPLGELPPEQHANELASRRRVRDVAAKRWDNPEPDESWRKVTPSDNPKDPRGAATVPADKGRPSPVRGMEPASSGAGFVLGLLVWTVAVNYVQGGVPQVRRLLAAKFLNKTD